MEIEETFKNKHDRQAGLGLMEAIVGGLVLIIVGSVLFQFGRQAVATYKLNSTASSIADSLGQAKEMAQSKGNIVKVIFDSKGSRFGVDRNGNGKLDSMESEELPSGVAISEDAVVVFSKSGGLARESKQPRISISNNRSSRTVSVSSMGSVVIE